MVAEARTWVDIEIAVREWARENVPGAEQRVFLAANPKVLAGQIVVQRIAGPDDACLIQFDVWGGTTAFAASLATELATALDHLSRFIYQEVMLHGADVFSVRRLPDPESAAPRYIVEATITASSSSSESETGASS